MTTVTYDFPNAYSGTEISDVDTNFAPHSTNVQAIQNNTSGHGFLTQTSVSERAFYTYSETWGSDQRTEIDLVSGDAQGRIFVATRLTDTGTGYGTGYALRSDTEAIVRFSGASQTTLVSSLFTIGSPSTLTIISEGSNHRVYEDGVFRGETTDSTYSGGFPGLGMECTQTVINSTRIDNFVATDVYLDTSSIDQTARIYPSSITQSTEFASSVVGAIDEDIGSPDSVVATTNQNTNWSLSVAFALPSDFYGAAATDPWTARIRWRTQGLSNDSYSIAVSHMWSPTTAVSFAGSPVTLNSSNSAFATTTLNGVVTSAAQSWSRSSWENAALVLDGTWSKAGGPDGGYVEIDTINLDITYTSITLDDIPQIVLVNHFDDSTDTIYSPTVELGTGGQSITLNHFDDSSDTLYSVTIVPGAVSITTTHYDDSTDSFYTTTISPGPVSITNDHIDDLDTLYSPAIEIGPVTIISGTIDSVTAIYPPTVVPQAVTLAIDHIPSVSSLQEPTLSLNISTDLYSNISTLYQPTLDLNIYADTYNNTNTIYQSTVAPGAVTVEAGYFASSNNIYSPTVSVATLQSLRINSSGDYARRTTDLPNGNLFTITGWMYVVNDRTGEYRYFGMDDGGTSEYKLIGWFNNNQFMISTTGGSGNLPSPPIGEWVAFAIVSNGSGAGTTTGYWLDSGVVRSASAGGSLTAGALIIGSDSWDEWVDARFADVKVWDQALTQTEIETEWQYQAPQETTDLHAYWPLDGDANDYSGNGRHLVVNGTVFEDGYPDITLSTGAQGISLNSYNNSSQIYSPTIVPGAVSIEPSYLDDSSDNLYSITVIPPAIEISNDVYNNASVLYDITVIPQPVTLLPDYITSVSTIYSQEFIPGAVEIAANHLDDSVDSIYDPTIHPPATEILANHFSNSSTLYDIDVTAGAINIVNDAIVSTSELYSPQLNLNILANNISSVSHAYSQEITTGPVSIEPDSIAESNALYSPDILLIIYSDSHSNVSVLYDVSVQPGPITIEPVAITGSQSFYQVTITTGVDLVPDPIANVSVIYDIAVIPWAVTLELDSIASTYSIYDLEIVPGPISISFGGHTNSSTIYSPIVSSGEVIVEVNHYNDLDNLYDVEIQTTYDISLDHYNNSIQIHEPTIVPGSISLELDTITSISAVHSQTVSAEDVIVPDWLQNNNQLEAVTIAVGPVSIENDTIFNSNIIQSPEIVPGAISIEFDHFSNTSVLYSQDVSVGAASVVPDNYVSTNVLYDVVLDTGPIDIENDLLQNTSTINSLVISAGSIELTNDNIVNSSTLYDIDVSVGFVNLINDSIESTNNLFDVIISTGPVTISLNAVNNSSIFYSQYLYIGIPEEPADALVIDFGSNLLAINVNFGTGILFEINFEDEGLETEFGSEIIIDINFGTQTLLEINF